MTLTDAKEFITKRLDTRELDKKNYPHGSSLEAQMEIECVELRWVLNLLENVKEV